MPSPRCSLQKTKKRPRFLDAVVTPSLEKVGVDCLVVLEHSENACGNTARRNRHFPDHTLEPDALSTPTFSKEHVATDMQHEATCVCVYP